jgi:trans-aconitate methyltransferase
MIKTRTMPRPLSGLEAAAFTTRALATYLPRPILRRLSGRSYRRTPETVIAEYHGVRAKYLQSFQASPPPLEEYLLFEADQRPSDTLVHHLDNRLVIGTFEEASRRGLARIVDAIAAYQPSSVMEFGCGAGHNLLAIKQALPTARCIGLELTAPSVELGRAASAHYDLPVEFYCTDITKPSPVSEPIDICFSVHALEQIPDARAAFDQMYRLATKAVVLFEPIPELWNSSLLTLASRVRARHLDRLHNLYPYLRSKGYEMSAPAVFPQGTSLNRTVELHVLKLSYPAPLEDPGPEPHGT